MSIIKPCDIRGKYPAELDGRTARALGRALGARLAGGEILVAGDVRTSTAILKGELVAGLVESGTQVTDLGTVATPVFYHDRRHLKIHNGVMVTASHNPVIYNGFKITLGEEPIEEEELQELAREMEEGVFAPAPGGTLVQKEVWDSYRRTLLDLLSQWTCRIPAAFPALKQDNPREAGTLVLDCGSGSASLMAPDIFRAAGFQVHELYYSPDGSFPHREPNPAVAANLQDLSEKVRETGAFLGLAFDGDGDRVAFVDSSGEVREIDAVLAVFSRFFASRKEGTPIVHDIKCSMTVPEEIVRAGGRPIVERSGHTYIRSTLLRSGAAFGGELSGHCFFGELGNDDALLAGLLFAAIVRWAGFEPLDAIPRYPSTPDLRIPYGGATGKRSWKNSTAD